MNNNKPSQISYRPKEYKKIIAGILVIWLVFFVQAYLLEKKYNVFCLPFYAIGCVLIIINIIDNISSKAKLYNITYLRLYLFQEKTISTFPKLLIISKSLIKFLLLLPLKIISFLSYLAGFIIVIMSSIAMIALGVGLLQLFTIFIISLFTNQTFFQICTYFYTNYFLLITCSVIPGCFIGIAFKNDFVEKMKDEEMQIAGFFAILTFMIMAAFLLYAKYYRH